MTAYIEREIRQSVQKALRIMPVVVLTGMRQTGKTTFLKNDPLFKDYRYVSLDDFAVLQTALADPSALLFPPGPVCIDEAQKAPQLMTAVKKEVDRRRHPGRIVLSGSANFSLLKGISESLAGRAVYFTLQPFTRRELSQTRRKTPFILDVLAGKADPQLSDGQAVKSSDVLRGGMPPVRDLSRDDASTWFRGFEQTYLERDIRDLARVEDLFGFRNIIKLASLRTGQLLNFSQLARDARLSLGTATRYIELAEASFLMRRLPPFLRNRSSRLIKTPKLYVEDSGLASYLSGVESLDSHDDEPMRGALFETYAATNLAAILGSHLPNAQMFFWNVQGRHEVDIVVEHHRASVAIEVKAATRWTDRDLASLKVFLATTPTCRAAILAYNGTQSVRLGPKLWAVPLSVILS